MNNAAIDSIKKNGRVPMSSRQIFWHYTILFLLLLVPIILTVQLLSAVTKEGADISVIFLEGYVLLIVALWFFIAEKRALKFNKSVVTIDKEHFKTVVEQTAKEFGWKIKSLGSDHMIAINTASWRSFGEQVTIIQEDEKIWFNSIGNPANLISIVSSGMHKRLQILFEEHVTEIKSTAGVMTK